MNLSLRNRIALFYLSITSVITLLVFIIIYQVVHSTSYNNLDERLEFESLDILDDLDMRRDTIFFTDLSEWNENEHKDVEVYPIFAEVKNIEKKTVKKTPNLKNDSLSIIPESGSITNSRLHNKQVRQIQSPVINRNGNLIGYILVAVPLEDAASVVANLRNVMFVSYPMLLILLFFISRYIAGKSIIPLVKISSEAKSITKDNLNARISMPQNKDEIHELAQTINSLMHRLEDAVLREKQFTADASHELRTPLAVIKGTLEVLIRKPRDTAHYQNKIGYCIREVDRIGVLIDQLLMLARSESAEIEFKPFEIDLSQSVQYCIYRLNEFSNDKGVKINFETKGHYFVNADPNLLNIILENLLTNAVKYSGQSKLVNVILSKNQKEIICSVSDKGIGMNNEQLLRVFDRFYRSDDARSTEAGGHGIGLAIVKRLTELQNIKLKYISELNNGTTVNLIFNQNIPH